MMSKQTGYHFLQADYTAANGMEAAWTVGERRTLKGSIKICDHGYHASPSPWDALQYAQGPVLCLVELSGVTKDSTHGDKWAGRSRKLIKAVNVERELHELACQFAESVLHVYERDYPDDQRPRQAIETKRRWMRGEATDGELYAARDAAWAAAMAAARDAAWDAAMAAAWDATWDAARAAARAAAWAAARTAAWDAASDAAWDAASQEHADLTNRVLLGALEAAEVRA